MTATAATAPCDEEVDHALTNISLDPFRSILRPACSLDQGRPPRRDWLPAPRVPYNPTPPRVGDGREEDPMYPSGAA